MLARLVLLLCATKCDAVAQLTRGPNLMAAGACRHAERSRCRAGGSAWVCSAVGHQTVKRSWSVEQRPAWQKHALRGFRRVPLVLLGALLASPQGAVASAGAISLDSGPLTRSQLVGRFALWVVLFSTAAILAGAETAITTLWPWKVKQLAAEDGAGSPFETLDKDITKVLTTVLVGVTFCMIFGTALATDVAVALFGKAGVGYATIGITAVTLFFGEILPKSLAVRPPGSAWSRSSAPAARAWPHGATWATRVR